MSETAPADKAAPPSHSYDYQRARRISLGQQSAIDVPISVLRVVATSSAHSRRVLTEALGEQTVGAVVGVPEQRAS